MPKPVLAVLTLAAVALTAGATVSRGAAAAGPTVATRPFAVGAAVVGQRVTAEPGTWGGSGTISFHYQWYRCDAAVAHCSSVHGATGRSYRIVAADAGHTVALTVGATDGSGTTSAYAGAIGPVATGAAALVSTVQPIATGVVATGKTLTVDGGSWSARTDSLAYAWLRCNANARSCAAIAGATAATYTATVADAGHALVVQVTAASGGGHQAALSTPVTAAAPAATTTATTSTGGPSAGAAPTVGGSPAQGARLTGTAGSWAGSGTISYRYQWYRCDTSGAHCSSIHGATAATYTLVAADVSHTMGLTVNATDGKGTTAAYASLVGPVAAAGASLVSTVQPAITGTAAVGKPLSASNGTWSATPTAYEFAWQRCNANGRLCAAIAGATSASYTPTAADSGHRLLAVVQATAGDATAQALSGSVKVG